MTGFPRLVWGCLIAALAVVAVWLTVRGSDGADQASSPPATSATSPSASSSSQATTGPTAVASSDPPGFQRSKAQLNNRVQAFCRLYFARSPELTGQEIKRQVTPYATAQFLETAPFGYGSSVADQRMIQEQASLTVDHVSVFYGELNSDRTMASGVVIMHVTKEDKDGHAVTSFSYQQAMTWLLENGVWRIGSIDD